MARQAGDPKVRYVGFTVTSDSPVARRALIDAMREQGKRVDAAAFGDAEPWLTRYDGTHGIVRCHHTGTDVVRASLNAIQEARGPEGTIPVRVETVGTSGTIRGLVQKALPALKDAGNGKD